MKIEILKEGYKNFGGVKGLLILEDETLVLKRDNIPTIPNPDKWDFVGGGREKQETPLECFLREAKEEIGLDLTEREVEWANEYDSILNPGLKSYFLVIKITKEDLDNVIFGDEGQEWGMMKIKEYLERGDVCEHKHKIKDYLKAKDIKL